MVDSYLLVDRYSSWIGYKIFSYFYHKTKFLMDLSFILYVVMLYC